MSCNEKTFCKCMSLVESVYNEYKILLGGNL